MTDSTENSMPPPLHPASHAEEPDSARVSVDREGEFEGIDLEHHRNFARILLDVAGEGESELAILLTGDESIHRFNREYRGIDQATDVLSFSQREGEALGQLYPLGDIVISVETAGRQAGQYGHGLTDEIDELIFHGVMHLLGYDHDGENRRQWHQAEEKLIQALQQRKTPYIPKGMTPLDHQSNNEKGRKN